jgi:hypothetical protein
MKNMHKFLVTLYFLSFSLVSAQNSDEPIWKALNDELSRNMKELSYLDYEKPFFINYTIGTNQNAVVLGSLGAIILSNENKLNTEMVRVMVGNYKLNDENFENENNNVRFNGGNISLPLDADYYGIRRTFWLQTDKVYKAAGETYKNKVYILKRNNLPLDSLTPDFSPAPVSKLRIDGSGYIYRKSEWEKRIREISSDFIRYPDIDDSGVSFRFAKVNTYMVNSEGSEVKSPMDITIITISASTTATDGMRLTDRIEVIARTPDDLPSNEWFRRETELLASRLKQLKTAEPFSGVYNGPVLFLDQAASEFASASLFSQEDPLIAIREPLYADRNMKIFYGNNPNSLENKQNKRVTSAELTVKAMPLLENFQNQPLIGHYKIDADGVVPPQEITLIENGLLRTLLCDRTPTRVISQSNGHRRFALFNNGVSYLTGPGVIDLSGNKTSTRESLMKQLIEKAVDEGLDYAIVVKKVLPRSVYSPVEVYKVSVTDGKETLIRSANIGNVSLSSLRKCAAVSDRKTAYNMMMNVGPDNSGLGSLTPDISGLPASFISPDGLLIEDLRLEGAPKNLSVEKPIVPNPVSRENLNVGF